MTFENDYETDFEKRHPEEFNLDVVSSTTLLSLELARVMGRLDPDGEMVEVGPSLGAVQRAWNEIAGEQLAEITRSVYLRGEEVVVVLSSPLWAQELGFLSAEYCERLNVALETDTLKKVSFRVR